MGIPVEVLCYSHGKPKKVLNSLLKRYHICKELAQEKKAHMNKLFLGKYMAAILRVKNIVPKEELLY